MLVLLSSLPYVSFSLSCIGEGNGNPPQCSCLGNSMGRGAWQAIVLGIAKESDTTEHMVPGKG